MTAPAAGRADATSPRRRRLGLAIAAAGLLALVLGGLQAADLRGRLGPVRLLVGPSAVLATPDGRVVVASRTFSKLHVYDPDGRPLRAWELPTGGAPFRVSLTGDGRLAVAPESSGTLLEFDLEGALLATREREAGLAELGGDDPLRFQGADGALYRIEAGRVLRSADGAERVIANGFASHATLTLALARVALLLIAGSASLLGGVLLTARRAGPAAAPAGGAGP